MLLALNSFKVASSGPTPSTARTPIGMLLALTRRGAVVSTPSTARTPIGLLLALTRRGAEVSPPATGRTPIGLLLALTRPSVLDRTAGRHCPHADRVVVGTDTSGCSRRAADRAAGRAADRASRLTGMSAGPRVPAAAG